MNFKKNVSIIFYKMFKILFYLSDILLIKQLNNKTGLDIKIKYS